MWESELEKQIRGLLVDHLKVKQIHIVLVQFDNKNKILEISIERENGDNVTIEDCSDVSRFVSNILDVEDPIKTKYILQVSSPGMNRPLTSKSDFQRFKGRKIKVNLSHPIGENNMKRVSGKIIDSNEEAVTIFVNNVLGNILIEYGIISRAELVVDNLKEIFNKHNQEKKALRKRSNKQDMVESNE